MIQDQISFIHAAYRFYRNADFWTPIAGNGKYHAVGVDSVIISNQIDGPPNRYPLMAKSALPWLRRMTLDHAFEMASMAVNSRDCLSSHTDRSGYHQLEYLDEQVTILPKMEGGVLIYVTDHKSKQMKAIYNMPFIFDFILNNDVDVLGLIDSGYAKEINQF